MQKLLFVLSLITIISCQQGYYCDEWNKCGQGYYCFNKKCQIKACSNDADCGSTFVCDRGHCDPTTKAEPGRYCDQWTPCPTNQQCFKNHCAIYQCWDWNMCPQGMVCDRAHCYQFTPVCSTDAECVGQNFCDRGKCCSHRVAHNIPCWIDP